MWYLIGVSALWAFSFELIKTYLGGLDPALVALIRLALSLLVFLPFVSRQRPSTAGFLVLTGALQFGLMYCLYIASYKYLSAAQVALLTITTPLYVVAFDGLFQKRWVSHFWLAALLTVIAVFILLQPSGNFRFALKGALLVQAAGACFAAGQMLYKRYAPDSQQFRHFAWLYLGAVAVPLVYLLLKRVPIEIPADPKALGTLAFLGVFSSGVGFFLWNKGVKLTDAGTAAVMNNMKIPLGIAVSLLIFNRSANLVNLSISAALFVIALFICRKK